MTILLNMIKVNMHYLNNIIVLNKNNSNSKKIHQTKRMKWEESKKLRNYKNKLGKKKLLIKRMIKFLWDLVSVLISLNFSNLKRKILLQLVMTSNLYSSNFLEVIFHGLYWCIQSVTLLWFLPGSWISKPLSYFVFLGDSYFKPLWSYHLYYTREEEQTRKLYKSINFHTYSTSIIFILLT